MIWNLIKDAAAWTAQNLPPSLSYQFVERLDHLLRGQDRTLLLGDVWFPFLADESQKTMYYGLFEPEVAAAIHSLLPRGGCFFDVGANVGYFTAVAANVAGPSGRFFGFEPHPDHFARLAMLARLNESRYSMTCVEAAVLDHDGSVTLHESKHAGWHSICAERIASEDFSQNGNVPALTLDSFARDHSVERIDLLKIDVEGAEDRVLRGAKTLLKEKRIGAMVVELFHPGGGVMPALAGRIEELEFNVADAVTGRPPDASVTRMTSNVICTPRL